MPNAVLKTEGLLKKYGSLTAVKDLTLEVYEGEVFGFLGPNGAGKTTAINMMCGLLKPDAGQVMVHGVPLTRAGDEVRARVGVCPQDIVLWERLTCREQLQFIGQMYGLAGREARSRAEGLLDDLGLADKRNTQARKLSGGMQRRLNLAMALVHDPEILVLDEPEAGLDPQSRVRVREYIQSLARKKTVILTTHNMDEAERVADRVAIIDQGELLVLDTPQALKQRVGEGDVVEIGLGGPLPLTSSDAERVRAAALSSAREALLDADRGVLTVRALNAVGMLPAILDALRAAGVRPGEIHVRENTLEDVFIRLTGRRLRE
jgi:ABC-2 type transport system ATP-binding protein